MLDSTKPETTTTWFWWFPPACWLAEYRAAWLPGDIVAGITLAAYAFL
jgi:MFS superfamily sulfate permease-like transporter